MLRVLSVLILGGAIITPLRSSAQSISVYPHLIVVDARTHTASVTLANSGDVATEVTLSTFYGYPATDAHGTLFLQIPDTTATTRAHPTRTPSDTTRSAVPWVQILPERILLPPHTRRTIRLLIDAPNGIPDGEYWARLAVTIQAGQVPVQGTSSRIQPKLALKIRTVFPIVYRTGTLLAGVQMQASQTSIVGDSLVTRTTITRTGNSAYLGSLTLTLRNAKKQVVAHQSLPLSVYYTVDPKVALSIRGLPRGTYTLDTEMQSSRPDVPAQQLLHAPATRTSGYVTLP